MSRGFRTCNCTQGLGGLLNAIVSVQAHDVAIPSRCAGLATGHRTLHAELGAGYPALAKTCMVLRTTLCNTCTTGRAGYRPQGTRHESFLAAAVFDRTRDCSAAGPNACSAQLGPPDAEPSSWCLPHLLISLPCQVSQLLQDLCKPRAMAAELLHASTFHPYTCLFGVFIVLFSLCLLSNSCRFMAYCVVSADRRVAHREVERRVVAPGLLLLLLLLLLHYCYHYPGHYRYH